MNTLARRTLTVLEKAFRRLEQYVPPPRLKRVKGHLALRYREQSIEQALIQKLARLISTLHAAQLLLESGFIQEQGSLQRILDELHEDIIFLAIAITNDKTTALHQRYLKAFWAEEFDNPSDPVGSHSDRDMVPRPKIRAYVSRIVGSSSNPSRDLAVSKTISKVYSGYVHAASPHIMEMCDGTPPRFHLSGMLGTQRMDEHEFDIWNYYYRGLVSATVVGKAFGDSPLVDALCKFSFKFQGASGRDFGAKRPEA
jgi:hypothetical protein